MVLAVDPERLVAARELQHVALAVAEQLQPLLDGAPGRQRVLPRSAEEQRRNRERGAAGGRSGEQDSGEQRGLDAKIGLARRPGPHAVAVPEDEVPLPLLLGADGGIGPLEAEAIGTLELGPERTLVGVPVAVLLQGHEPRRDDAPVLVGAAVRVRRAHASEDLDRRELGAHRAHGSSTPRSRRPHSKKSSAASRRVTRSRAGGEAPPAGIPGTDPDRVSSVSSGPSARRGTSWELFRASPPEPRSSRE